jgi:hypothetical protein
VGNPSLLVVPAVAIVAIAAATVVAAAVVVAGAAVASAARVVLMRARVVRVARVPGGGTRVVGVVVSRAGVVVGRVARVVAVSVGVRDVQVLVKRLSADVVVGRVGGGGLPFGVSSALVVTSLSGGAVSGRSRPSSVTAVFGGLRAGAGLADLFLAGEGSALWRLELLNVSTEHVGDHGLELDEIDFGVGAWRALWAWRTWSTWLTAGTVLTGGTWGADLAAVTSLTHETWWALFAWSASVTARARSTWHTVVAHLAGGAVYAWLTLRAWSALLTVWTGGTDGAWHTEGTWSAVLTVGAGLARLAWSTLATWSTALAGLGGEATNWTDATALSLRTLLTVVAAHTLATVLAVGSVLRVGTVGTVRAGHTWPTPDTRDTVFAWHAIAARAANWSHLTDATARAHRASRNSAVAVAVLREVLVGAHVLADVAVAASALALQSTGGVAFAPLSWHVGGAVARLLRVWWDVLCDRHVRLWLRDERYDFLLHDWRVLALGAATSAEALLDAYGDLRKSADHG